MKKLAITLALLAITALSFSALPGTKAITITGSGENVTVAINGVETNSNSSKFDALQYMKFDTYTSTTTGGTTVHTVTCRGSGLDCRRIVDSVKQMAATE